jgi:hypothetical protein
VVINEEQLSDMQFDTSMLEHVSSCNVPKANPKHAEMLSSLKQFLITY